MNYTLICDGAYSSSRDSGGLAFIFLREGELILEYSKKVEHTTNNRMELGAIIIGLTAIKKPIDSLTVVSDSMYCIGTITKNWKRNKNQDLWGLFDLVYSKAQKLCPNIQFVHVKGHQKDDSEFTKWNNYVDELARKASNFL